MAFQITNEWIIDIPEAFEHRVEDNKLIFWTTGISVIVVAFRLPDNTGKIELLTQIREKMPDSVLETLVSTQGEIAGLGFTQIQKSAVEKNRLSLFTFTVSDSSCLQTAFYLDDPDDLDWAKTLWKGIVFIPQDEQKASKSTA